MKIEERSVLSAQTALQEEPSSFLLQGQIVFAGTAPGIVADTPVGTAVGIVPDTALDTLNSELPHLAVSVPLEAVDLDTFQARTLPLAVAVLLVTIVLLVVFARPEAVVHMEVFGRVLLLFA